MFYSKEVFKLKLREELEQRITLNHPIFDKLMDGTPNRKLLNKMTLQGYQLTKNFLDYVETLFYFCPEPKHKKRLLFNLFEEETGRLRELSQKEIDQYEGEIVNEWA